MTDEWLDTKSNAESTAKQPHPHYCCKEIAPPYLLLQRNSPTPLLSVFYTAARTALHYPRLHNQAKEARLYTAAKQLKPPAKRAASSAMVKQN